MPKYARRCEYGVAWTALLMPHQREMNPLTVDGRVSIGQHYLWGAGKMHVMQHWALRS